MDKYHACNFLFNIFINNKLLISGEMAGWGTQDPRRGSGFYRLASSHTALIW